MHSASSLSPTGSLSADPGVGQRRLPFPAITSSSSVRPPEFARFTFAGTDAIGSPRHSWTGSRDKSGSAMSVGDPPSIWASIKAVRSLQRDEIVVDSRCTGGHGFRLSGIEAETLRTFPPLHGEPDDPEHAGPSGECLARPRGVVASLPRPGLADRGNQTKAYSIRSYAEQRNICSLINQSRIFCT